jgi:hypothetical protein
MLKKKRINRTIKDSIIHHQAIVNYKYSQQQANKYKFLKKEKLGRIILKPLFVTRPREEN